MLFAIPFSLPWNFVTLEGPLDLRRPRLYHCDTSLRLEFRRRLKAVQIRTQYTFYKQLALGWQIAKQPSELNPLSLSSNKKYRLKKSGVFSL